MIKVFFRNNESNFSKWCRHYVRRAKAIIRYHDNINDVNFLIRNKYQYNEAKVIIKQYEVLKCSLSAEQNELLEKYFIKNEHMDYNYKNFNIQTEIISNWSKICFPKHKPKIKTIDKQEIGKVIKEQRLFHCYTLKYVADLLQLSEATLKSYEEGTRLVRLDVIYGLAQIYDISVNELIENSNENKKL